MARINTPPEDGQAAERRGGRPQETDLEGKPLASPLRQDIGPARLGAELAGDRRGGTSDTAQALERATAVQGDDDKGGTR